MATTTNYSWTTPDDTALVKDGAAAIRSLGSSIDTTTKNLNPSTTLGDIEYRSSTANTNTRLGIGTTNQVLTVAAGVPSWADVPTTYPTSAENTVAANQTTTSTSYTNLTTSGPSVTMTTGTKALIILTAEITNDGTNAYSYMDFDVSGATTRSATDTTSLTWQTDDSGYGVARVSSVNLVTLTAGSNTFTAKYRTSNATKAARFSARQMIVINLA